MSRFGRHALVITAPYWIGSAADALWAVALFVPRIFGALTGIPDFDPDQDTRLVMAMGGILMTGWTVLLVWAVREPIERRFVILLTAFPVVFGLFIVSLIKVLQGNSFQIWILIKTTVLFVSMLGSYILAGKVIQERHTY